MGQCLQAYTERDWNFSSRIRQTAYLLPGWCLSVGALTSRRLESISSEEKETHSSEEPSVSFILYTRAAYSEGGRASLKRYTWEKYYLWKRRDTSLSDRCGQGCHLSLTSAWVKKGLWGCVPPLSICLMDNEAAFRQPALAVRRPHLPIDALRVTSFQEEFGIKNVSVTTHILRGVHMWELEVLNRISLQLIQHT